jgi:hypothetical protein
MKIPESADFRRDSFVGGIIGQGLPTGHSNYQDSFHGIPLRVAASLGESDTLNKVQSKASRTLNCHSLY